MTMEMTIAGGNESVNLAERVFGQSFNEALIHQVVTAERAGMRAGTKAQKTRSEVRGGGKKPWRQKGTGRARAGTIRSPIWAGGGATFAARPRSFDQKVNKKMYRGAMRSMLSSIVAAERLFVVADVALAARSTKEFLSAMSERGAEAADLLVVSSVDEMLGYSARNVPNLRVVDVAELNSVDLVGSERMAVTASAKSAIEEWLG